MKNKNTDDINLVLKALLDGFAFLTSYPVASVLYNMKHFKVKENICLR